MAQLGEAISRYHKLLEAPSFRDTAWADELQEQMRRQHITDSGRLIAPVLRPHFISKRQLESLSKATASLAEILGRVEQIAFASPYLLSKLQMLPAEKMLAAVPVAYTGFGAAASFDANVKNGSLYLQGLDTCKPAGLAYGSLLADLMLELPIVKEFKRGRYKLSKIGGPKALLQAIQNAWKQFGGKTKPCIAIVEMGQEHGNVTEGALLAEALSAQGATVRVASPEQLQYSGEKLRIGEYVIDVVYRRLLTRELLTRWDLNHPLLRAYRDGAVCVVNNFRAEFAQRRALFDVLTDETMTAQLPASDRKLLRSLVSWTRVVSQRKTKHDGTEVDLPEFILSHREQLVLLPSEDASDRRVFIGSEMTQSAWDRALRLALRTPYVVQERLVAERELFPIYQYGELKMKEAEVAVHPHLLNGEMNGASAVLQTSLDGAAAQLGVAPVLLLEDNS